MIRVNKKFYESGCTMEGKGNRVFLKTKDGKVHTEMIFVKDKVIIHTSGIERVCYFKEINEIYSDVYYGPKKVQQCICIETNK